MEILLLNSVTHLHYSSAMLNAYLSRLYHTLQWSCDHPIEIPCWTFDTFLLHSKFSVRASRGCCNGIFLHFWHSSFSSAHHPREETCVQPALSPPELRGGSQLDWPEPSRILQVPSDSIWERTRSNISTKKKKKAKLGILKSQNKQSVETGTEYFNTGEFGAASTLVAFKERKVHLWVWMV